MADNKTIIDVQGVTQLSKIIACNTDYYNSPDRDKESDSYTLFIVNNGATNGETPFVDLYYGNNKLSQMIVTETLPYPGVDGKVYIKKSDDTDTGGTPMGLYLYQSSIGGYLPLTNLAETGKISSESQEAIANLLFDKISASAIRPTWKILE